MRPPRRSGARPTALALGFTAWACTSKPAPHHRATGETDSGEQVDTGTDSGSAPMPEVLAAPPWLPAALTVPADSGWAWELDPTFAIPSASVPSVFIGEGGVYGMLLGMQDTYSTGRDVAWSEDGLTWSTPEPLIAAEDFGEDCGLRIEDGGLWDAGPDGRWLVLEGTQTAPGSLNNPTDRRFCRAGFDARPGGAAQPADPPILWSGCAEDDVLSVPGILPMHAGARVFFNGTCQRDTAGVHAIDIDSQTFAVEVSQPDAQLPGQIVDPNPVYREGGGVDMFVKLRDEESALNGIARVRLTDDGRALAAEPVPLLWPEGPCFKPDEQSGPCYADPSFVRAADGRLVLYFGEVVEGPDRVSTRILRAFATDHPADGSAASRRPPPAIGHPFHFVR